MSDLEVRRYRGGRKAAERHLAYCLRELEKEQPPEWRQILETKRDIARAFLDRNKRPGHCQVCGVKLRSKVSLERGVGPECWSKLEKAS